MLRNKDSKETEQIIKDIISILESENEKQWSSLFKHYFHQIKNLKLEEFKVIVRKNFRRKESFLNLTLNNENKNEELDKLRIKLYTRIKS